MKRKVVKRILRIFLAVAGLVLIAFSFLVYRFTSPRSDAQIDKKLKEATLSPLIGHYSFEGKDVRVIHMQQKEDTLLPTLFFVHGSPGSAMDFERYFKDSTLNSIANLISYDRIGYGTYDTGEVLSSLEEEVELLHQLLDEINAKNIILIGYSYGGTVVMASDRAYKKKIVLAAAVRGDLEPQFWALNLYKWKLTRPLVPKVFRGASIEKIRHIKELPRFADQWNLSPSKVMSIHGKEDLIVPYENSLFLKQILDPGKFDLITLEDGNHSLIWTNFEFIKAELIKSVGE